MSHDLRFLEATSGQGAGSVGGERVGDGVGKGNKLAVLHGVFGLKACTLPNLALAESKSREEEQGQAHVW